MLVILVIDVKARTPLETISREDYKNKNDDNYQKYIGNFNKKALYTSEETMCDSIFITILNTMI